LVKKIIHIQEKVNTKFLVGQMILVLDWLYYAIRLMVHINNMNSPKAIYYACFHCVIKYEITFWGKASNNGKIFTLEKKFIRIMAGAQPRSSCRCLFKQLRHSNCSMSIYILNNQENFQNNSLIQKINSTISIKISTNFTDQMPNYLLKKKKKYILCWHQNLQLFTIQSDNPKNEKAKF
jgi:hypothetical protein